MAICALLSSLACLLEGKAEDFWPLTVVEGQQVSTESSTVSR